MFVTLYLSITGLLFAVYGSLIFTYRKWFVKLKPFELSPTIEPQVKFSIIIPARNEALNIEKCLTHIKKQNYPTTNYEVWVINDFSTDDTANVVLNFGKREKNIHLINLADVIGEKPLNSYKKKAIELAVSKANFEWIITTDADCWMGSNWLRAYNAYILAYNPVFVGAPVVFSNNGSMLESFQSIDFMTMQGVTAAAVSANVHSMCNGANLAYTKKAFIDVNGFAGIDNLASGDDMLLMNKIKQQFPGKLGYLFSKQAIVATLPMPNWQSFLNQRIRWASKADKYNDKSIFIVLLCMYCYNLSLFIMPLLSFLNYWFLVYFLIAIVLKTAVEMSFALPLSRFFGIKLQWKHILLQYPHIAYMVIAGWMGKFGKYQWKGRTVK
ncbi:MAG: glycosyltransferase [Chitinophagaceae bacterium]